MIKTGIVVVACLLCSSFILHAQHGGSRALPHVLVYKTKAAYRSLVPVILSEDKKQVVSFPAPADVTTGSGYPLPVLLHKGYLLDRRGIGLNSAFLKLTYAQYAALKEVPPPEALYDMLVDKDPLVRLYDCGIRDDSKNDAAQLNKLIDKGQLSKKCREIKK